MAMTINTNVNSLTAQRNAITTQNSLAVSMQRLSSGLRVNSARDDAAGLAIADRMNTQVRGMNVAIRNANDGISLAQVAEGGLSVMGDMLQRMRELAVQAINSTNTSGAAGDLGALNQEFSQLRDEVNRTMSAVQFNGTSLFITTADFAFQVGANSGQTITISGAALNINNATGGMSGVTQGAGAASALNITTNAANSAVLVALDTALSTINATRATLGAVQSRFENTINYLRTAVENQSAARGRIMDADFAAETSNLSRAQILQQAGTAMIAQANQLPQGVLRLLQG
ncbi:flagellin and related hook-associated protein [Serpentinimonas maccroryi]|uniref:Flagellin n=1 Tax=Serpentinimonas maccroryi TaxID=1458426 RepID=A0A060NX43_9BURK|nr:flagellin [Serpentinimonas maccroryi]BAO83469.1 flagellin and related hook-associated protein [Serpentinimonas maccroryi]